MSEAPQKAEQAVAASVNISTDVPTEPPWPGRTLTLSNGVRVDFRVGASPEDADLAVCSTDWAGNTGP